MPGKFLSKEARQQMRERRRKRQMATAAVTHWTIGLVVAAVILLNLFTHVLQIVRYNGNAMEPNLHSGQTLVILRTQEVKEGDIIAFYYNNQVLVRRVICTGGKQVSIANDGSVSINSRQLEEPYLTEKSIGLCTITFPHHVQSGYVFVMGDSRTIAMDSRLEEIGSIPEERIIGKVLLAI